MAKIEVTINGVAYPCRPTMGAMLRFKRETGKEVTEITQAGFTDLCTYLYCCVASASAADGVDFRMSLMEFADALTPEDMAAWTEQMQQDSAAAEAEKKVKAKRHLRFTGYRAGLHTAKLRRLLQAGF